jgi:hypothetical protein
MGAHDELIDLKILPFSVPLFNMCGHRLPSEKVCLLLEMLVACFIGNKNLISLRSSYTNDHFIKIEHYHKSGDLQYQISPLCVILCVDGKLMHYILLWVFWGEQEGSSGF